MIEFSLWAICFLVGIVKFESQMLQMKLASTFCLVTMAAVCLLVGCQNSASKQQASTTESNESRSAVIALTEATELSGEKLIAAALSEAQLKEGWIRLFDGQSMIGWSIVGNANWSLQDDIIRVDSGEKSFLTSELSIADYELKVEFRCDKETNSGLFLRTVVDPMDVRMDCIELNIAPPSNPFPTGSLVERFKLEPEKLGEFDPTKWHEYHIRMEGVKCQAWLDGKQIVDYIDDSKLKQGHIALQHNSGKVEFRNILLRPLGAKKLRLGADWQEDWTKSEKEPDTFKAEVTQDGLRLTGGLGQLQSKTHWGDFVLQACYKLTNPDVNSGIFFRCVADAMLDGYECQVNHSIENKDPLHPKDSGAGAIFRRQSARVVMCDGTQPTYLTLMAAGPTIMTWVNGVQVVRFKDDRAPDINPRKGLRLEAGPIALQGHDSTTDVLFSSIEIAELR